MSAILKELFRTIVAEAERNPDFRHELEKIIGGVQPKAEEALVTKRRGRPAAMLNPREAIKAEDAQVNKRPKNRRTAAVLNPYEAIKQGEHSLATQLQSLNIEQLKDVVSEFAIDSSKLALKWKSRERLIDLIVLTTKGRLEKGDAFRTP